MNDEDNTKDQLLKELKTLRNRLAELRQMKIFLIDDING